MSTRQIDDSSLDRVERSVVAAREGSYAALGQLFDHYHDYLLGIARQDLGKALAGKIAPSDVVQETFLQATKAFPKFDGRTDAELRAWLRKILINQLIDIRKSFQAQKRCISLEVPLEPSAGEASCPQPRPSSIAVTAESQAAVEAALARLPKDYRRVLILRSFENLPFTDVGIELDRSADAARRLWTRAIQRLAAELDT